MADNDDGEEKSQEPTDQRKKKAREDGQVLTSKELFVFVIMAAGTGLLALTGLWGSAMAIRWQQYFRLGQAPDLNDLILQRLSQFWFEVLLSGIVFALPLAILAILLQSTMGGLNFNMKSAAFKPSRINPMQGLGRMVSMQALVDLGKGLLKVGGLGSLAVLAMKPDLKEYGGLIHTGLHAGLAFMWRDIITLLIALCLGLGVIGALDLGWQMFTTRKKMLMSFKELKDENKESNGSPEVKGKVRMRQAEISQRGARQRASLENVPQATAIITNPIHFAVALHYIPGESAAPKVISMGKGPLAQEIILRGKGAKTHVLQSPLLARALYFTSDIGAEIEEGLFSAVAVILAHVYRLDRGEYEDMPKIDNDLPEALRFNEFGHPEASTYA